MKEFRKPFTYEDLVKDPENYLRAQKFIEQVNQLSGDEEYCNSVDFTVVTTSEEQYKLELRIAQLYKQEESVAVWARVYNLERESVLGFRVTIKIKSPLFTKIELAVSDVKCLAENSYGFLLPEESTKIESDPSSNGYISLLCFKFPPQKIKV